MYQIVVDTNVKNENRKRCKADELIVEEFTIINLAMHYVEENVEKGYRVYILKK